MYSFKPIGLLKSPFTFKNGTPRQPSVCQQAKGIITIDKDVFNNPEHSLEGLEEFSHVWIFFIFHKNNNAHTKAKVKPPRLNGKKTGVFSTRSPYRPNNIGLTLAKIEQIEGACLTVSGIDILDGTPVVDLKPYIPHYDCPTRNELPNTMADELGDTASIDIEPGDIHPTCHVQSEEANAMVDELGTFASIDKVNAGFHPVGTVKGLGSNAEMSLDVPNIIKEDSDTDNDIKKDTPVSMVAALSTKTTISHSESDNASCGTGGFENVTSVVDSNQHVPDERNCSHKSELNLIEKADTNGKPKIGIPNKVHETVSEVVSGHSRDNEAGIDNDLTTAKWVVQAPVAKLEVRWTPSADEQLKLFKHGSEMDRYKLQFLKDFDEAKVAIVNILREDPRSTYRRKHCIDQLYYFTLDCVHVTCWFDDNCVEIVRVKPVSEVDKLCSKLPSDSH